MKNFTTIHDVLNPDLLVEEAIKLKQNPTSLSHLGIGKTIGLIFLNPSLRTRMSTQKAARMLGMDVMFFNIDSEGWKIEWRDDVIMNGDTVEHIKDAAAVLGMYCDIIGIRSFATLKDKKADYSEKTLIQLMRYCKVPVVSLESATLHPLQSLADAITIKESWKLDRKPKITLCWAQHIKALPQAVPNSFSEWMLGLGYDLTIAHPIGYELESSYTKGAKITTSQEEGLLDADFVYVKNWSSFTEYGQILETKQNWLIDDQKYKLTNNAQIMHCLPVRRNLEVSAKLIDGENSLVLKQAENRLYAAQVVIKSILEKNYSSILNKNSKQEINV